MKYSSAGVPLWTNRYHGLASRNDESRAIALDGSGNVIVTGKSAGGGNSDDYATIKYSNAGVPLWTNRYSTLGDSSSANDVRVDSSGNVFVTGYTFYNGWATIKYSSLGVPLWTNRYAGPATYNHARALAVDGSGKVFVTGFSRASGSGDDYATVAYSSTGVPLWTNRYNGPGNGDDFAYDIALDGNGKVFVTGGSMGTGGSAEYATIAYSNTGVPLWTNRYKGPETASTPERVRLRWTAAAT